MNEQKDKRQPYATAGGYIRQAPLLGAGEQSRLTHERWPANRSFSLPARSRFGKGRRRLVRHVVRDLEVYPIRGTGRSAEHLAGAATSHDGWRRACCEDGRTYATTCVLWTTARTRHRLGDERARRPGCSWACRSELICLVSLVKSRPEVKGDEVRTRPWVRRHGSGRT